MVKDEQDWKILVVNIANGSADNKESIQAAEDFLWDALNWTRLKNTPHGRFVRELVSSCPDYTLRALYRNQVLG